MIINYIIDIIKKCKSQTKPNCYCVLNKSIPENYTKHTTVNSNTRVHYFLLQ